MWYLAVLAFSALLSFAAQAQEFNPLVRERIMVSTQQPREGVGIQISINLHLPGPTGDSEDAAKLRERARRLIYNLATGECQLLLEVLAKECRLDQINVNLMRQAAMNAPEGYNVTGTLTLRIQLK